MTASRDRPDIEDLDWIPIYCVVNESEQLLAEAEGRTPEIASMHRTVEGARRKMAELHAEFPGDTISLATVQVKASDAILSDIPE